ncbi:MAG: hypothetical protein AAGG69_15705 [Pseudomonadota bacterium]
MKKAGILTCTALSLAMGLGSPYAANSASGIETVSITETSAVFSLNGSTVFIDPVGNQAQYRQYGRPDIVVLTRAAPQHLSIDTMIGVLRRDTIVLAPQEVIDRLPLMISNNVITPFQVGSTQRVAGIRFTALPKSARQPDGVQVHQRQRGDMRVLVEANGNQLLF